MISLAAYRAQRKRRLDYLRSLEKGARGGPGKHVDHVLSFVAVEAMNFWIQYCRDLFLLSSTGAVTEKGLRVKATAAKFASRIEVLSAVSKKYGRLNPTLTRPPGGLEEPKWGNPKTLIDCGAFVGLANVPSFQRAAGIVVTFRTQLRDVRNFAAHRCEDTARQLRQLGVQLGVGPHPRLVDIMHAPGPGGSPTAASEWLAEIDAVIDALVE